MKHAHNPYFTKYHLLISRDRYRAESQRGTYAQPHLPGALNIAEAPADYDLFTTLLKRVGGPWGWDKRPRYRPENSAVIRDNLAHPATHLYLLRDGADIVGYCLSAPPQDPDNLPAFPGAGGPGDTIEIENFGFFPEHTGKQYGRQFLPALFAVLLQEHAFVYLSTRSTNHNRVVPFYQSLGMEVVGTDILPHDLEKAAEIRQRLAPG